MNQAYVIKISFGMIVLNGEPFLKYNLENLYPHAHEILIVEGAVEKFAHAATPDGHSLDKTVEIVRNFPDPEGKIKLIQCEGFWPEKDEMANAYMAVCTGNYIWQVDVDEFYRSEDIEKIRAILASDPEITRVDVRSICFLRSFNARVMGSRLFFGADEFIRIFSYKPGYRYVTHRPPTLADENGLPFQHKKILSAYDLEQLNIVQYHYTYIFHNYVKDKADYYSKMGWGGGHEEGLSWFSSQWLRISNPLRVHIHNYPPSWLVPFYGTHPEVVTKMISEISYEEDPEIVMFMQNDYKKYSKIGKRLLNIICRRQNNEISKLQAVVLCWMQMLLPIDKRAINANYYIKYIIDRVIDNRLGTYDDYPISSRYC